MPINTDSLDLTQPLAGQDIPGSAPLPNPVISKERLNHYRELLEKAGGGAAAAPPAAAPLTAPSGPTTRERTHALPVEGAPAAPPAAEIPPLAPDAPPAPPPALDPASLVSPRQREHFKKLEAARDSFKERAEKAERALQEREARLRPLEEEVARFKAAPPVDDALRADAAKATALAEENRKLLAKVESLDFERSDRFQNWWKAETDERIKQVQQHVPVEQRDKLARLMREEPSTERDTALSELTDALGSVGKRVIDRAIEKVDEAKLKRAEAVAENSGSLQKLRAAEQAERLQAARAMDARREQITRAALAKAEQLDAFKPIEGDSEHNAAIEVKRGFIRAAIAGQLDEDIAVAIPGLAFEAVHLRDRVVPALKAELEKERALVKQLQSAGAPPRGEGSGETAESAVKPGAAGKFLAAMRKAAAGT